MSKPIRHADGRSIHADLRTFFVTSSTCGGRHLLQSDRMARLLIDTLYRYRTERNLRLHAFVVMTNHLHVLLSVDATMAVERAVQLIKGGFSYRASHEYDISAAVWARGFSDSRIHNEGEYAARVRYIHENPVRAGLTQSAEQYPYSSAHPGFDLDPSPFTVAKARTLEEDLCGTTKVVP